MPKFAETTCATCGRAFRKRRHEHRYCSAGCRDRAFASREGRLSNDPKFKAVRERRDASQADLIPTTGKRRKCAEKNNKFRNFQRPISRSSNRGIAGAGLSRKLFARILEIELSNVPLVPVKGGAVA